MSKSDEEAELRRKQEEALEVKSLRQIISTYLNYRKAADEGVKRYERSFRRLEPSHKALLSHLPLKYRSLRRCIAKNSYFIYEMLKAFQPPIDLSKDLDIGEQDSQNTSETENSSWGSASGCDEAISGDEGSGQDKKPGLYFRSTTESHHVVEGVTKADKAGSNSVSSSPDWLDPSFQLHVPLADVDKVQFVIRNIVRDWAAEGQQERDQCYKPILEELKLQFPNRSKRSPPACLVPGAGLGRLALEISRLGFASQGNEFSYYMMICSSFILNQTERANEWTIYPWIHSNCNSLSDSDQLRPVSIPDIHPASAGITEGFSMCGGDFVEVYSDPSQLGSPMYNLKNHFGAWDAVVTCFFLDTASNVVEYIEVISKILKEGAVWINLGPLLYHFADVCSQDDAGDTVMSIELSLEDVKKAALHYGFQLEKEQTIQTTYATNPRSMMHADLVQNGNVTHTIATVLVEIYIKINYHQIYFFSDELSFCSYIVNKEIVLVLGWQQRSYPYPAYLE
ncbi:hypothetical protein DCAR_0626481 [Daucus carota subsp. sativus]|uniref:carnosine N-methyltransferase n=1 Tax=Daucus carota subsp. sativus TaxID=79200 RepID=A0AAF0XHC8_DAUCS|nr:hypothetical protein DCAR_0626481 [Daucus carota subsp. sativus]